MAEQAGKSTNQITSIIQSVVSELEEAGKLMEEVVEQFQLRLKVVDENGHSFGEIAKLIKGFHRLSKCNG